jgi:hypothetical protein
MKLKLLLFLLFFGNVVFSQTDSHIRVLGTKCSLIPPEGFVLATDFYGFQNAVTGVTIKIDELPISYSDVIDGFEQGLFNTRGLTLLNKEEIDYYHSKATLVKIQQTFFDSTFFTLSLIFGNDDETVYVKANYPEPSETFENVLKEALLSTVYNAEPNENPEDAATYTLDVSGSEFKCIQFESGSLFYSTDGKIRTEGPSLTVDRSFRIVTPENQKQYAKDRLMNLPEGESYIIKETNDIIISGLNGYEIIALRKINATEFESVYQVILYNHSGGYYLIVGQSKKDIKQSVTTFRAIALTFKTK